MILYHKLCVKSAFCEKFIEINNEPDRLILSAESTSCQAPDLRPGFAPGSQTGEYRRLVHNSPGHELKNVLRSFSLASHCESFAGASQ